MTRTHRALRLTAFRRVGENRRLRRSFISFLMFSISEFGTWVTVLVYAYAVGDANTVALVAVAQLVPAALLAPFLSSALERLPRATAAMTAYGSQAVALGATATAMAVEADPILTFTLAALANVTVSMGRPAHNSLVPELVDEPSHLVAANVVTTSIENLGVFAGPALAGFVMGLASPATALAVLAIGLALGTLVLITVPRRRHERSTAEEDTGASGFVLKHHKDATPFVIIGSTHQIAIGALDVLIVLLAVDVLGVGDSGAGYLNAALGLGGVLGGIAAASIVGRTRLTPALGLGVALRASSLLAIGFLPGAALFLAGAGVGTSILDVASRTLIQRSVPVSVMPRVFGLVESGSMWSLALGSLVAAPLATLVGIPLAFSIMGLVQPTIALVAWRWLRRSERAAVVHLESLETLMAVELFAELEPASLEALARVAEPQEATDGAVIIKEGERGNDMWIVESGRVAVTREGRTVRSLGRGEVVGEIALLSDRLRIATVTAEEKVKLLRIDRDGFIGALSTNQATSRAFRELALSRTTETLGE